MSWRVTVKFKDSVGTSYTFPGPDNDWNRAWMREKTDKLNRRYARSGGTATFEYVEDRDATRQRNAVGVRK